MPPPTGPGKHVVPGASPANPGGAWSVLRPACAGALSKIAAIRPAVAGVPLPRRRRLGEDEAFTEHLQRWRVACHLESTLERRGAAGRARMRASAGGDRVGTGQYSWPVLVAIIARILSRLVVTVSAPVHARRRGAPRWGVLALL